MREVFMALFVPAVAAWLRTHHGIISRSKLIELGVSPGAIRTMVSSGELVVVHEGVYRHAVWPATFLSQSAAACAADERLVIGCGGAVRLWQVRSCAGVGFHLVTSAPGRLIDDGTTIHRCSVLPPAHVHERSDGIRVTSPARLMFDLSKHVSAAALESAIEQGLRRSQFDVPTLYDIGRLLCRRGRAGSRQFADVLTSRPMWRRPVDSHPELELLNALAARGIHLGTQEKVTLPDGRHIHPDLGDPRIGFYIEIDDHEWHGGRLAATYDRQRDRQLRLLGARVERVSTDEIRPMSRTMLSHLVEAYHQHRSAAVSMRSATRDCQSSSTG